MKIDTTHAECRQWIKENLEDLTFDEKKKVLRRTDKETLFGFNSSSEALKVTRILEAEPDEANEMLLQYVLNFY